MSSLSQLASLASGLSLSPHLPSSLDDSSLRLSLLPASFTLPALSPPYIHVTCPRATSHIAILICRTMHVWTCTASWSGRLVGLCSADLGRCGTARKTAGTGLVTADTRTGQRSTTHPSRGTRPISAGQLLPLSARVAARAAPAPRLARGLGVYMPTAKPRIMPNWWWAPWGTAVGRVTRGWPDQLLIRNPQLAGGPLVRGAGYVSAGPRLSSDAAASETSACVGQ